MVRFFRNHWQLTALLALVLFQLIAVGEGWVLFTIGNVTVFGGDHLYITFHALIMLGYKVIQKRWAYLHNKSSMKITRSALAEMLIEDYADFPKKRKQIWRLANRYTTFDKFIFDLKKNVGCSQEQIVAAARRYFGDSAPPVSLVAPIYDLKQSELELNIRSLANQVYTNLAHVYLVINDAKDIATKEYLNHLIAHNYSNHHTKFHVIVEGKAGKRNAQWTGFWDFCQFDGSKYFVNMDGDGFGDLFLLFNSIVLMENNPKIGLLTADVRISNWKQNWLTVITGIRYMNAGWEERASQSLKGQMICGSGPWLVMRREAVLPILPRWKTFTVQGQEANFGDDRQLTLEIMMEGWLTVFGTDCIVYTDCPTRLKPYWWQQVRWNKSSWIYNFVMYTRGLWHKLNWFVRLSVAYLMFYPFIMVFAMGNVFLRVLLVSISSGLSSGWVIAYPYVMIVLVVGFLFQSLSGLLLFHDWRFLLAPSYVFLWFGIQIPARPYSGLTYANQGWGTRKKRPDTEPEEETED